MNFPSHCQTAERQKTWCTIMLERYSRYLLDQYGKAAEGSAPDRGGMIAGLVPHCSRAFRIFRAQLLTWKPRLSFFDLYLFFLETHLVSLSVQIQNVEG